MTKNITRQNMPYINILNSLISCSCTFQNNLVSNILTLSVPDEGYTRHVSRTLNYISTFLFKLTLFLRDNKIQ